MQLESKGVKTKIMSGKDLLGVITEPGGAKYKAEFLPEKEGGAFHYCPYWSGDMCANDFFASVVQTSSQIVGMAIFFVKEKEVSRRNGIYVDTVSVHKDVKGQKLGYPRQMIEEIFKLAKSRNLPLLLSDYTDDGNQKLRHIFEELSKKYVVEVGDQ